MEYNEHESDPTEAGESEDSRLRELTLFSALPLCLGAVVIAVTLALPGSSDTNPRALFSNCLLNGVAAVALSGVIQVWFTMGETRRADRERARADRETARADRERARADQERARADQERAQADKASEQAAKATALASQAAERAERAERDAAGLRLQVDSLTETVAELQRRLDERYNGNSQT